MKNIKFYVFVAIVLTGVVCLLFLSYFFYFTIHSNRIRILKENSISTVTAIRDIIHREIYGIAMGFTWWDKMKEAIDREDKKFFKDQAEDILNAKEWIGMIIVKDGDIIYRNGVYPNLNYTRFVPLSLSIPDKVFTHRVGKRFFGIVSFSICGDEGEGCLGNRALILLFDWQTYISKFSFLFKEFKGFLSQELPKESLYYTPLRNEEGKVEGYIVFQIGPENFEKYAKIFLFLITLFTIVFAFFILHYFLKQHIIIEKITCELEWRDKERKEKDSRFGFLSQFEKSINIERVIDKILGTIVIHKIYKNVLEVAIRSKNLKETLRALSDNLKEAFSADYWSIVLTPSDISQWKYFIWSSNLDGDVLEEILEKIKIKAIERFNRLREGKEVLFIEDIRDEDSWVFVGDSSIDKIVSSVQIPMIVRGEVVGILFLDWTKRKTFSEKERIILREIKDFIADVLESAYDIQDMFWLSYRDPLLKIYNRRVLDEISDRDDINYILFIDIDNFKQVNDIYGHAKGDEVLKGIATILKKIIRKEDLLIRWGGDEFVICVKNGEEDIVKRIKERIEETVYERFKTLNISVSIGITRIEPGESLKDAIERADMNMYMVKRIKKR